jgi:hypothetical protein
MLFRISLCAISQVKVNTYGPLFRERAASIYRAAAHTVCVLILYMCPHMSPLRELQVPLRELQVPLRELESGRVSSASQLPLSGANSCVCMQFVCVYAYTYNSCVCMHTHLYVYIAAAVVRRELVCVCSSCVYAYTYNSCVCMHTHLYVYIAAAVVRRELHLKLTYICIDIDR